MRVAPFAMAACCCSSQLLRWLRMPPPRWQPSRHRLADGGLSRQRPSGSGAGEWRSHQLSHHDQGALVSRRAESAVGYWHGPKVGRESIV